LIFFNCCCCFEEILFLKNKSCSHNNNKMFCMGDAMDGGFYMIRQLLGCLCCICCIGVIMFIVGLTMLFGKNNYALYTTEYAAAVSKWQSSTGDKSKMTGTTGTLAAGNMAMTATPSTKPISDISDLPSGEDIAAGIQSVPLRSSGTTSSYPTTATLNDGTSSSTVSFPSRTTTTKYMSIRCRTSYSSCSSSSMQSKCRSESGCSSAIWTGGSCYDDRTCSGCSYSAIATDMTVVVKYVEYSTSSGFSFF
jgi:hypothetical protein